jgi:hypothetical protein
VGMLPVTHSFQNPLSLAKSSRRFGVTACVGLRFLSETAALHPDAHLAALEIRIDSTRLGLPGVSGERRVTG